MFEVRNAARIEVAVEGSIEPSSVHPTTMTTRPHAALAVQLREGLWLAASPARSWLSRTAPDTTQAISTAAVRSLLEGAVAAAGSHANLRPPRTSGQWIWQLIGFSHVTHSAPALLEFAAERFAADNQPALARWTRTRARELARRHELVIRDLQAMGVDPARAIAAVRPHPAERVLAWLRSSVLVEPIACVGFVHAIERLGLQLDAAELEAVEAMLPEGVRATRCVRAHVDHSEETIALLTRLSVTRCELVTRAAFEVAGLCVGQPDDASLSHERAQLVGEQPR